MATVTGLTAARMLAIEAASVISGLVNATGDLILTKYDGSTINAGSVIGPEGPTGPSGADGADGADGLLLETVDIAASGNFSGSFSLSRLGRMVIMFGYCDNDSLNTGSNLGSYVETGAVIPVGWRPPSSIISAPHSPYASSGVQYRYRINNVGTTDGKVMVQRNAVEGTWMVIDSMIWLLPAV